MYHNSRDSRLKNECLHDSTFSPQIRFLSRALRMERLKERQKMTHHVNLSQISVSARCSTDEPSFPHTGMDQLIDCVWMLDEILGRKTMGNVSKAGPRPRTPDEYYGPNGPFVETFDEAKHFQLGPEEYEGGIFPWREPIRSPQRPETLGITEVPSMCPVVSDRPVTAS